MRLKCFPRKWFYLTRTRIQNSASLSANPRFYLIIHGPLNTPRRNSDKINIPQCSNKLKCIIYSETNTSLFVKYVASCLLHRIMQHDTDLTLANIIFIPFFCQYKLSPDKHRIIVLVSWLFLSRYWQCQYYQYYCQNYPGSVLLLPIAACCWIGENLVCSDFCVPLLLSARVRLPNHG